MPPDNERDRPVKAASTVSTAISTEDSLTTVRAGEVVLRVAWLRVHADHLLETDPSGLCGHVVVTGSSAWEVVGTPRLGGFGGESIHTAGRV